MSILFFLLTIASLICLLIGVIKPDIFRLRSRKFALYIFGGASLFFFILFVIAAPKVDQKKDVISQTVVSPMVTATTTATTTTLSVVADNLKASSTVVTNYGVRTKTSNCTANQALPDSACTPGAILTIDAKTVCVSGYSASVRNVPDSIRKQVFIEYGIPYSDHSNYEVDHLISLELGGSNDISNLFPEPYNISNGARVKDKLENYLHRQVCSGALTLNQAQYEISHNWILYYQQISPTEQNPTSSVDPDDDTSATVSTQTTQSNPQPSTTEGPAVKKSSSGICHAKGTTYYDRTQDYTSYSSVQACLDSGGRLPK